MKKTFFVGLVTLLPLAVTFFVVVFVVDFLTLPFLGWIAPFLRPFIVSKLATRVICEILILIALFFITLFLGFVARKFFFNRLIKIGDNLLKRIPLVNKIYKTSKEIVRSLFSSTEKSFQQVVLLSFPYNGAYCIGLIASRSPEVAKTAMGVEMVSVYIPTTPNPATGYLVMCRMDDLIMLDMKSEEAIKYVVSCGVIQPEEKE